MHWPHRRPWILTFECNRSIRSAVPAISWVRRSISRIKELATYRWNLIQTGTVRFKWHTLILVKMVQAAGAPRLCKKPHCGFSGAEDGKSRRLSILIQGAKKGT